MSFLTETLAAFGFPDDKLNGTTPLSSPTRKWSPHDANRAFTALKDLRTAILSSGVSAMDFEAVGDGVADDTAALQAAIDGSVGKTLHIPKGKYKVTSTLFITQRSTHIVGDYGNRSEDNGTEISYTGVGPCIQIHTDSGNPWSDNEYNGKQDHVFEHLEFRHGAPDTTLIASGGVGLHVKLGAYGIWDWRGGGITIHGCRFEHFEASFVGIQSDLNRFFDCKSNYSKWGFYLGPRSDQNTIIAHESLFCDRAITIDRASGTRIIASETIGCGTATSAHIEIRRAGANGTFGVSIESPWFEAHSGGYQGTDILGFVSVGEVDGYGAGGSIQAPGGAPAVGAVVGCTIENPKLITFLPGVPGHVRHVASVGKCQQFLLTNPTHQNSGALTNLVSLVGVQATQAPTNVETQVFVGEVLDTLTDADCFVNLGGGAPAITIEKYGASGRTISSNVRMGASTAAAHTISGSAIMTLPSNTNAGGMLVQNTTANTGNSACLRGLHNGTVDTSGGFRQAIGVNATSVATRSAGASTLENTGLLATASGGQTNRAIATIDGDVVLNGTSGITRLNIAVKGTGTRAAAPAAGTHEAGEVVFNADPIAGGKAGWICTAGGTPGTWKAWGPIDP